MSSFTLDNCQAVVNLSEFLRMVYPDAGPDDLLNIVAIQDKPVGYWVDALDHQRAAGVVYDLEGAGVYQGVYFAPALTDRAQQSGRFTESCATALPGLSADIDYGVEGHRRRELPPTLDDALSLLDGLPKPTVIVQTGHGIQPYWLFDALLRTPDEDTRKYAKALQRGLQRTIDQRAKRHGWSVDMTFSLDHLMRLPGTTNRKSDPVAVYVLDASGVRYDPTDFEHMAVFEDAAGTPDAMPDRFPDPPPAKELNARLGAPLALAVITGNGDALPIRDKTLSGIAFYAVAKLAETNYDAPTIAAILLNPSWALAPHYDGDARRVWTDVQRVMAKNASKKCKAYELTELGNTRRFMDEHRGDFRFTQEKDWLAWDGQRWAFDTTGAILRAARTVVEALNQEVAAASDEKARKALLSHTKATASRRGLENITQLARSEAGITVPLSDFDANPWLLNVANGTLDLRTGKLRPPRRDDMLRHLISVPYEPGATAPLWANFLQTITGGDGALVIYLQKLVGMCLTGDTSSQLFHVFYGTGQNGKSTLLNVIRQIMGTDLATEAADGAFSPRGSDAIRNDLAAMARARLVTYVESEKLLDAELVKKATGGDPITARFLNHEYFTYVPSFKLIMVANKRPVVRDMSHGFWRRVRLVPFDHRITAPEEAFGDKLRAEYPGVLAWAIEGCLRWQAEGLTPPRSVLLATDEYKADSDPLAEFLADYAFDDPQASIRNKDLRASYKDWAERSGVHLIGNDAFRDALTNRGLRVTRPANKVTWHGIRKAGDHQEPPQEDPTDAF